MLDLLKEALLQGLKAFKLNLIPALILWAMAAFTIVAYYYIPQSQFIFDYVLTLKSQTGLLFAFVSTGFFGAVVPTAFSTWVLKLHDFPLKRCLVLTAFWGVKGIEIEYLYLFQNVAFGHNVLYKLLFDEFVYVPIWGVTSVVLFYHFMDSGYSFKVFKETLGKQWYRRRVFSIMVPNWCVWIPAVVFIYLLPQPLQLPLQNLTLAFWAMVLAYLTLQQNKPSES